MVEPARTKCRGLPYFDAQEEQQGDRTAERQAQREAGFQRLAGYFTAVVTRCFGSALTPHEIRVKLRDAEFGRSPKTGGPCTCRQHDQTPLVEEDPWVSSVGEPPYWRC